MKSFRRAVFAVGFLGVLGLSTGLQAQTRFNPQIDPLEQSRAYKLFLTRPQTELSKLVFLIDRFKDSNIKIIYDGIEYSPPFVAKLARWFLPSHYHDEKAEKWIMVWCNKSYSERRLVWVKDPSENVKLAREVLIGELKVLEEKMAKQEAASVAAKVPAVENLPPKV